MNGSRTEAHLLGQLSEATTRNRLDCAASRRCVACTATATSRVDTTELIRQLPLDQGHSVENGQKNDVDARIALAEFAEAAKCLSVLFPVWTHPVRKMGIGVLRDCHAPGEHYALSR